MKYRFNNFELDTERFELCYQGKMVALEPQVFSLLVYLLEHRDRVVSKQELLDKLWPGKVVTESSLNTCIKHARKAVHDNGQDQHTIATVQRRGFRFAADVQSILPVQKASQQGSDMADTLKPSGQTKQDDRLSLVVIPFSHNPADTDCAWWAEVMSEDISIHLARIPGFKVISRHSVMALYNAQSSASQVGHELNTQYVIDGSVRKHQQDYRISVQLIDVDSGQLVWANHRNLASDEMEAYESDIVQKIVLQIEPELNRAEFRAMRHRKPEDMGGWTLCREAIAVLAQKGWSRATFSEVASLLRQAINKDPELAFAHALLSLTIALGHLLGLLQQTDWQEEATHAAEKALELDSQNSDVLGHAGCAFADMGDFQRGIPLMKRALDINPGNAQAWAAIGAAKMRSGDVSGAEDMRNGLALSPRDNRRAAWGAVLARGLLSYGQVKEAIATAEDACLYDDKIFLPRVILAIAFSSMGEKQKAVNAWKDAQRILPGLSLDDISSLASSGEIEQLKASFA